MEAGDRLNTSRALTRFPSISETLMGLRITEFLSGRAADFLWFVESIWSILFVWPTREKGRTVSVATEHLRRKN